jgi:hypothetical protein
MITKKGTLLFGTTIQPAIPTNKKKIQAPSCNTKSSSSELTLLLHRLS